ncbi:MULTISPECIES: DUF4190 domain-containing protein [Brevibacterium]|uniref:DUF4190 domain-containing protein n=1 Tax=Brevibacterium antiquum CNRZ 918 TaxID=1255637 RepID=A0A2H1KV15_9MICO|nr:MULTISPECIES: DUF4190 domain-containing protein [Brevibacterium]SMY03550.1 protein of unknown function (DUF4190) [Brevibacterium antiquum CNRZ 918]HCG55546.1 DUF4190 domain-containing protein [Brevibacterium sp.]
MHTRQLPASSGYGASDRSPYGGAASNGGFPNNAAYVANPGWAGPVAYVYQPIAATNTVAIIGMVLALAGALSSFIPAGIAGIVMGHIARKQIRQRGERGDAMALTALWVGYLSAGFWALFWIVYILLVVLAVGLGVAEGSVS